MRGTDSGRWHPCRHIWVPGSRREESCSWASVLVAGSLGGGGGNTWMHPKQDMVSVPRAPRVAGGGVVTLLRLCTVSLTLCSRVWHCAAQCCSGALVPRALGWWKAGTGSRECGVQSRSVPSLLHSWFVVLPWWGCAANLRLRRHCSSGGSMSWVQTLRRGHVGSALCFALFRFLVPCFSFTL